MLFWVCLQILLMQYAKIQIILPMRFSVANISACNFLLENKKVDEFHLLTVWYSNHLLFLKTKYSDPTLILPIVNMLSEFKESIDSNYPFANKKFSIFMVNF